MIHSSNGPILEGNLADFNLVEVLQVLSVSRQYTRVELFDDDRLLFASVFVKSGKILQAATGVLRGKAAFLSLIRRPPVSFRVFRVNTPALVPEPIGALSNLLFEALEADEIAPEAAAATVPRLGSRAPREDILGGCSSAASRLSREIALYLPGTMQSFPSEHRKFRGISRCTSQVQCKVFLQNPIHQNAFREVTAL
jgi:hypothetical protein